ncbi:methionyl-tRNA formyltransferase [Buchnera aphidicola (Neophyllaphis varicolor)]|uniref:methionyl-tRNA formyltransferase n=1 Tax=Buchnera aphidicola TaxID=9 RepID=UPI0031B87057
MNKSLKIIFAGTPNFAVTHLKKIVESNYKVVCVITRPDKISGRGKKLRNSPVKEFAIKNNIEINQPKSLNNNKFIEYIKEKNAHMMIVVAYGLIIPETIINLFNMGCINVHASLLPRWRGSSPIQYAIINGDINTGVTVIKMDKKIDHGKIIDSIEYKIKSNETSITLEKKLSKIGSKLITKVINNLIYNNFSLREQNHNFATYTKKIKKKDGIIDWKLNAKKIERQIRAFNPWPTSYFFVKKKIIKVWEANYIESNKKYKIGKIIEINKNGMQISTGNGIINIKKIQFSGKKTVSIKDILNSNNNFLIKDLNLVE